MAGPIDSTSSPAGRIAAPPAEAEFVMVEGRPDWSAFAFNVPCPRCEYSLRMLIEPRCPECGLQFDWRELIETQQRNGWLFEYRWRKRPIRTWLSNTVAMCRPCTFWSRPTLFGKIHTGALWFMVVAGVLASAGLFYLIRLAGKSYELYMELAPPLSRYGAVRVNVMALLKDPLREMLHNPAVALAPTLSFVGMFGTLMLLRQTLARCKVRSAHVLRVTAYCAAPLQLPGAGLIGLAVAFAEYRRGLNDAALLIFILLWVVMMLAVPAYVVGIALKRYLRLPRAWIISFTAAFVGLLLAFTLVMREEVR